MKIIKRKIMKRAGIDEGRGGGGDRDWVLGKTWYRV